MAPLVVDVAGFPRMTSSPFTIRSVQAFGYRYPLTTPVITSFGQMADRPAVFVRVEDTDGNVGWGEVWCNFPAPGAEHRVRLVNDVLAPALVGFKASEPSAAFERLTQGTSVLALQSGEAGPFAQSIAGIDLAVWDLYARAAERCAMEAARRIARARSRFTPAASIRSGPSETAEAALERGYRALKLKIGFDPAGDRANLAALRRLVGEGLLAADVNQGWTLAQALELAPQLERFRPCLARGADPCRPPSAGMEATARGDPISARGRREHCEPRRLCRGAA